MKSEIQIELPLGVGIGHSVRVEPLIVRFLEHCRNTRGLSEHTQRAYECDLRDFTRIATDAAGICAVSKEQILNYIRSLRQRGLRETTVKRRVATAKVLFSWLERERLIDRSVFYGLELAIRLPKRLPRALETQEMQTLLRVCQAEAASKGGTLNFEERLLHTAVLVMFVTGLRVSELASLRITDLAVNDAAIRVHGKGNRERRVYLPSRMGIRILKSFLTARQKIAGGDQLFITANGTPISPQWIRKRLAALAERSGFTRRVTPHMLRHTAATQLLEAGVDIRYVQRLLGHSSISTTQIYTEVSDRSLREHLERADTFRRVRRAV